MKNLLDGKNQIERGTIKATEIASTNFSGTFQDKTYANLTIEVTSVNIINGGIEIFARVFKDEVQLGFGADGSVDVERFRFFNPPLLVDDSTGNILFSYTDLEGIQRNRKVRYAPLIAIRQALAQVALQVGKVGTEIIIGKVGNTTSTFYPSMDGLVSRQGDGAWATARDTADGTAASTADVAIYFYAEQRTGPTRYDISRFYFVFDTSALAGQSISAATFSIAEGGDKSAPTAAGLIQITPASDSALEVGDYDALTLNSPTEGTASRPAWNGGTNVYTNWSMNATGISWINKAGNTKLGLRMGNDIDNVTPTARSYVQCYGSENTGTSLDPKLVVEHSIAPATTAPPVFFIFN